MPPEPTQNALEGDVPSEYDGPTWGTQADPVEHPADHDHQAIGRGVEGEELQGPFNDRPTHDQIEP